MISNNIIVSQNLKSNIKKVLLYSDEDIDKYINQFKELQVKNKISVGKYSDLNWILIDENGYIRNMNFSRVKSIFINKIKLYALVLLIENNCNTVVQQNIKTLIDFVVITNHFDEKYLKDFKVKFKKTSHSIKIKAKSSIKNYLEIILNEDELNNNSFYQYVSINKIRSNKIQSRKIPDYSQLLSYDYVIKDYFLNEKNEDYYKYYLINIWWKLSTVIPMRPIEVLLLKKNSVSIKNDKYIIKIERKKINQTRKHLQIFNEFEIDKKMYLLIKKYSLYLESKCIKSEYIFSFDLYIKQHNKKFNKEPRKNKDKRVGKNISTSQFIKILNNFNEDIIRNKYGFNLNEKILPIHTRHIAIVSMMIMGVNKISIARLAGHKSLNTQHSYANHLPEFCKCKVTYLYEKLVMQNKKNVNEFNFNKNNKKINYFDQLLKVEDGYCIKYKDISLIDYSKCPFNCYECENFILDSSNNSILENHKKLYEKNDFNLKKIISYLISVSTTNYENNMYEPNNAKLTNELDRLININALTTFNIEIFLKENMLNYEER